MSGSTPDITTAVPMAPGIADIMVDPHKVLAVAKVVEDQASALEDKLLTRLTELRVDPPSADVISTKAADAWNAVIVDGDKSYAAQVRAYVAGLHDLVGQLRTAAKDYKAGEEEKAAVFGDRGKHGA